MNLSVLWVVFVHVVVQFYPYNRPENCECLSTTKVSHLIGDKLKPETRSNDIKLQRVQSTLVKGVTPMVSIVEAC